jgi:predicted GH43/DUF377 family glycosyl hydrolase
MELDLKKNLALFPRKVNGKYAMLSRIDGVNNYLMYSDSVTQWDNPFSYRSLVIHGNLLKLETADPIWTAEGWLVITHGVGAMRRYCIGASLFDLMIQ